MDEREAARARARYGAAGAWALAVILIGKWAESHDIHPERARRRVLTAAILWFGGYLIAIGPLVRWQLGNSLPWWSLAATVLASPFLICSWRQWQRP